MNSPNVKNKSKRLQKKLHIGEFQIMGFEVNFQSKNTPSSFDNFEDELMDNFIEQAIEGNQLGCGGGGHIENGIMSYSFFVLKDITYKTPKHSNVLSANLYGKSKDVTATQEDIEHVEKWLETNKNKHAIENYQVSKLKDAWYDY